MPTPVDGVGSLRVFFGALYSRGIAAQKFEGEQTRHGNLCGANYRFVLVKQTTGVGDSCR